MIAIICPIALVTVNVVILSYYTQDVFVSTSKIMPVSGEGGSEGLSNWASKQFGVNLGSSKKVSLSSSEMVPALIKSRRLARELLDYKLNTDKKNWLHLYNSFHLYKNQYSLFDNLKYSNCLE